MGPENAEPYPEPQQGQDIKVRLPDGSLASFPAGTPTDVISRAVQKVAAPETPKSVSFGKYGHLIQNPQTQPNAKNLLQVATSPMLNLEGAVRGALPQQPDYGVTQAGPIPLPNEALYGGALAASKTADQLTSPLNLGLMAAMGAGENVGGLGIPGWFTKLGFGALMGKNAYQQAKQAASSSPDVPFRERVASGAGAGIDAAMAVAPFMGNGRKVTEPVRKPVSTAPEPPIPPAPTPMPPQPELPVQGPIEQAPQEFKPPSMRPWEIEQAIRDAVYEQGKKQTSPPPGWSETPQEVIARTKAEQVSTTPVKKGRVFDPNASLLRAVQYYGGVDPDLMQTPAYRGEWARLPAWVKGQISKKGTRVYPDELPGMVSEHGHGNFGSFYDILSALENPKNWRVPASAKAPTKEEWLESEVGRLQEELDRIKGQKGDEDLPEFLRKLTEPEPVGATREPGEEGFADILPFDRTRGKSTEQLKRMAIDALKKYDQLGFDTMREALGALREDYDWNLQWEITDPIDVNIIRKWREKSLIDNPIKPSFTQVMKDFHKLNEPDYPKPPARNFKLIKGNRAENLGPQGEEGFADIAPIGSGRWQEPSPKTAEEHLLHLSTRVARRPLTEGLPELMEIHPGDIRGNAGYLLPDGNVIYMEEGHVVSPETLDRMGVIRVRAGNGALNIERTTRYATDAQVSELSRFAQYARENHPDWRIIWADPTTQGKGAYGNSMHELVKKLMGIEDQELGRLTPEGRYLPPVMPMAPVSPKKPASKPAGPENPSRKETQERLPSWLRWSGG